MLTMPSWISCSPNSTTGATRSLTRQPASRWRFVSPVNGSAIISNPSLVFPAAAGTVMIRYWVGLKDPTKPYNNVREGKANGSTDNTYILYRAQFQPYVAGDLYRYQRDESPNGQWPTPRSLPQRDQLDANGNPVTYPNSTQVVQVPEQDDPDFLPLCSGRRS